MRFMPGLFLMFFTVAGTAFSQDISLPEPQTDGGVSVFDALKKRASVRSSDITEDAVISPGELSTVLWAASGLNRSDKGWTVPMAMGREPYVRLYVLNETGAYSYDWKKNVLKEVRQGDIRGKAGLQAFTATAPALIVFVSDGAGLSFFKAAEQQVVYSNMLVGAMSQDIYLASGALGLKARYIQSVRKTDLTEALKLSGQDKPLGMILLSR